MFVLFTYGFIDMPTSFYVNAVTVVIGCAVNLFIEDWMGFCGVDFKIWIWFFLSFWLIDNKNWIESVTELSSFLVFLTAIHCLEKFKQFLKAVDICQIFKLFSKFSLTTIHCFEKIDSYPLPRKKYFKLHSCSKDFFNVINKIGSHLQTMKHDAGAHIYDQHINL